MSADKQTYSFRFSFEAQTHHHRAPNVTPSGVKCTLKESQMERRFNTLNCKQLADAFFEN